jgi:Putative cyclase
VTGPGLAVSLLRDALLGRGVPWLEPAEHVFAVDLAAAGREQRVWVEEGDILLVRTGHSRRLVEVAPSNTRESEAGLDPTALRFVGSRAAAALGSPINPVAAL